MGKSDRRNGGGQRNLPPQAIEAEQAVLGGLLLSQEAWDKIADRLEETSFYLRQHRLIFRAIQALASNLKPRDYLTVSTWLNDNGLMGDIPDGMNYLIELAAQTPSSANIEAYAKIISDKGVLRDLAETGINPGAARRRKSSPKPSTRSTRSLKGWTRAGARSSTSRRPPPMPSGCSKTAPTPAAASRASQRDTGTWIRSRRACSRPT